MYLVPVLAAFDAPDAATAEGIAAAELRHVAIYIGDARRLSHMAAATAEFELPPAAPDGADCSAGWCDHDACAPSSATGDGRRRGVPLDPPRTGVPCQPFRVRPDRGRPPSSASPPPSMPDPTGTLVSVPGQSSRPTRADQGARFTSVLRAHGTRAAQVVTFEVRNGLLVAERCLRTCFVRSSSAASARRTS